MSQQINLFNPIFLKQKKSFSALNMLEALGLLLFGVLVFYGYARFQTANLTQQAEETSRQYNQSTLRLAQTSARYAPKKMDPALEAEVNNLQALLSTRKAALNRLGLGAPGHEAGYAEYMRALARQSLAGLWLTGFKVAKGGAEIEISGRALQPELVPAYIRRLNGEQAMQGRAFESLSMTQGESALPVDAARPTVAPASYSYTEFRLGTSHGELPAQTDAERAAKAAAEPPREILPGPQVQAQGGAGSK
jgi:hypothetical protein